MGAGDEPPEPADAVACAHDVCSRKSEPAGDLRHLGEFLGRDSLHDQPAARRSTFRDGSQSDANGLAEFSLGIGSGRCGGHTASGAAASAGGFNLVGGVEKVPPWNVSDSFAAADRSPRLCYGG